MSNLKNLTSYSSLLQLYDFPSFLSATAGAVVPHVVAHRRSFIECAGSLQTLLYTLLRSACISVNFLNALFGQHKHQHISCSAEPILSAITAVAKTHLSPWMAAIRAELPAICCKWVLASTTGTAGKFLITTLHVP